MSEYEADLLRRLARYLAPTRYGRMYIKHARLHATHTYHVEGQDCEACRLHRELKAYSETLRVVVEGSGGGAHSAAGGAKHE